MVAIPLAGGSYNARSSTFDNERTVNLYVEIGEVQGTKTPAVLYGRPGLKKRWTLAQGSGGIRALHRDTRTDRVFAVHAASLMELHADGTSTLRGTLASSDGQVSIHSNDTQMLIVDGQPNTGHVLTLSNNAFEAVTDPAFFGGDTVAFIGGYFVLNRPGTAQFYQSALRDGLTYNALDLATAEAEPDLLRAVRSDTRNLWLFGEESTEVWFNSGAPLGISFDRIDQAILAAGVVSPFAVATLGGLIMWLGETADGTLSAYRGDNFALNRISTHAVELSMGAWGDLSAVKSYAYQLEGHQFFVWHHPNGTWVYDALINLWYEYDSFDDLGILGTHRVCCHTRGFGSHLGGDYADGRVYELDLDTYTDDDQEIVARRRFAVIADPSQRYLRHNRVELDAERGVGLDASPATGIDPEVFLRWTDDHGKTWSNEYPAALGAQGEYVTRLIWRRLGRARNRGYEISTSAPVKRAFVALEVDIV